MDADETRRITERITDHHLLDLRGVHSRAARSTGRDTAFGTGEWSEWANLRSRLDRAVRGYDLYVATARASVTELGMLLRMTKGYIEIGGLVRASASDTNPRLGPKESDTYKEKKGDIATQLARLVKSECVPFVGHLGKKLSWVLGGGAGTEDPIDAASGILSEMKDHLRQVADITNAWVGNAGPARDGKCSVGSVLSISRSWSWNSASDSAVSVRISLDQIEEEIVRAGTELDEKARAVTKRSGEEALVVSSWFGEGRVRRGGGIGTRYVSRRGNYAHRAWLT